MCLCGGSRVEGARVLLSRPSPSPPSTRPAALLPPPGAGPPPPPPSFTQVLRELHRSCQTEEGGDDLKKGTQLLEIYALEIQLHTEQKNNKKLKELYQVCVGGAVRCGAGV